MSERTSFYRKVAYGIAIAILLFPLALLSSPATVTDAGGKLARLRTDLHLSQADLGKVDPASVGYINAHGTSTPLGDQAETTAIKRVFGEHARQLSISSTKSQLGHLLGASGGVEAIVACKSIQNNAIAPTINLDNPDPECDLDYTPHKAREKKITYAMSNSFGFGGHNASLLFKKM